MQVAAIFVLVVAGMVLIKFSNTRPETVYEKNYSEYELSVTRGADASDALEQAYRDKNWPAVLSAFLRPPIQRRKKSIF